MKNYNNTHNIEIHNKSGNVMVEIWDIDIIYIDIIYIDIIYIEIIYIEIIDIIYIDIIYIDIIDNINTTIALYVTGIDFQYPYKRCPVMKNIPSWNF